MSIFSSKGNDSVIISSDVTYLNEMTGQKVKVGLYYTKNTQDNNYIKMYEFSLNQCDNKTANLIQNQFVGPIVASVMNITAVQATNCIIAKGRNDVIANTSIPISMLPLFGLKRKLKLTLLNTARLTTSNKYFVLYNCSIYAHTW